MRYRLEGSLLVLIVALQVALYWPAAGISQSSSQKPGNQTIIDMVKAGMSDDVIIQAVRRSASAFDTSLEALLNLRKAGVSNAVLSAILEKSSPPNTDASAAGGSSTGSLPETYGVYAAKGERLTKIQTWPVSIVVGLRLSGDTKRGLAVDGLKSDPPVALDGLDYLIFYEPNINIRRMALARLKFVDSMEAARFNILNTPPQFFESLYGVPLAQQIPVRLWRRASPVAVEVSPPVNSKPDLYKISPARRLEAGHYALYDVDTLNRGDSVFTLVSIVPGKAYYFAIEGPAVESAKQVDRVDRIPEDTVCNKPGKAVVKLENAAMKVKPDFRANTKKFLPVGVEVSLVGVFEDGFCQVTVGDEKGWIRAVSLQRQ